MSFGGSERLSKYLIDAVIAGHITSANAFNHLGESPDPVYEGLIRTVTVNDFASRLSWAIPASSIQKHDPDIDDGVTGSVSVHSLSPDKLEDVLRIARVCGYYPSAMSKDGESNPEKFKQGVAAASILFEPKFQQEVDNIPLVLYHVTKNHLVKRILSQGLTPRSNSNKVDYPYRVYLSLSLDAAKYLGREFNIKNPVYLSIIARDGRTRYFLDPHFKQGVFTYSSVSPERIRVVQEERKIHIP